MISQTKVDAKVCEEKSDAANVNFKARGKWVNYRNTFTWC